MVIQKTKQKFNSPRSLTTRINLTDMTTEFKLRPPYEVTESDLGIVSNGSRYGHGNHSTPHHREKQQSSYNDQSFMGNVASSSSELVNSLLPTGMHVHFLYRYACTFLIQVCMYISYTGMHVHFSYRYACTFLIQVCMYISYTGMHVHFLYRYACTFLIQVCMYISHTGMHVHFLLVSLADPSN